MAQWIWYYGDFELYHALKAHTERLEGGFYRPAPWRNDGCYHTVVFRRRYHLEEATDFVVHISGRGCVHLFGCRRLPVGETLHLEAGDYEIRIEAANLEGLPAVFIEGDVIFSDGEWEASYNLFDWEKVGFWNLTDKSLHPTEFTLPARPISLTAKETEKGIVYDAGRESMARLSLSLTGKGRVQVLYGESMMEIMDDKPHCSLWVDAAERVEIPAYAFRYLRFVCEEGVMLKQILAFDEYLPEEKRGCFRSSDPLINRIWDVGARTLELCSRLFFIDGIKRDRYIWSGDAYQSYLYEYYLHFDTALCRRTILALRGREKMDRHINNINDYSFYWVLSIADYLFYTGDEAFVCRLLPKMRALLDFSIERTDENGMVVERPGDWIFIDWSEALDKEGPHCIEQILFARALLAYADMGKRFGVETAPYRERGEALIQRINEVYYCPEKGGYIDSFVSGNKRITRQTNIFAIRFGIADRARTEQTVHRVLKNKDVPPITTPYFQFYELECLCSLGETEEVNRRIKAYYGGMLALGATSFWEEYDPEKSEAEHYSMYGDTYGCSLCHAWGAGPVYLYSRFVLGVTPIEEGYRRFTVAPRTDGFDFVEGEVPLPEGKVRIYASQDAVSVTADMAGGTLIWKGKAYALPRGERITVS